MTLAWTLFGLCLVVVACIGCVVPVLPGPILAFLGILCYLPTPHAPSTATLATFALLTALATLLDYVVPAIGAKKFSCSRWGVFGCAAGTVAGLFFLPIGLVAGPFLGAFCGELIAGRKILQAAKGGLGAFLGFVAGTLIKLIVCFAMLGWAVFHL